MIALALWHARLLCPRARHRRHARLFMTTGVITTGATCEMTAVMIGAMIVTVVTIVMIGGRATTPWTPSASWTRRWCWSC